MRVKRLDDGSEYDEPYNVLILFPGARLLVASMLGTDDPRVMVMYDFVAGRKPSKTVIMGNEYIDLGVTENLVGMDVKVTLVQRPDHILPPLDRNVAADVHHRIRANDVELFLPKAVIGFWDRGRPECEYL